ncbi:MAG: hypothetical protein ACRCYU_01615 [Nocardioides sp.]
MSEPSRLTTSADVIGTSEQRSTTGNLTPAQRDIVEVAAAFTADVIVDGWPEAVADRANKYVTEPTWRRAFRGSGRRCRLLADLARAVLRQKEVLHDIVGSAAGQVARWLQLGLFAQQLAAELTKKIPLPPDTQFIAVARGVQITGILVCVADGTDLTRCQCFIDLALAETKTRVRELMIAATEDWARLDRFPPTPR